MSGMRARCESGCGLCGQRSQGLAAQNSQIASEGTQLCPGLVRFVPAARSRTGGGGATFDCLLPELCYHSETATRCSCCEIGGKRKFCLADRCQSPRHKSQGISDSSG